jgi:outer membrane lipoprotein-sorting protein
MRQLPLWILAASMLASTTAEAYVLPATFLIRMLADKRHEQKIKDLSIELNSEELATKTSVDGHLYLKQPRRLRLTVEGDGGEVYVEKEGACAAGTGGRLKRRKCLAQDLIGSLFVPGEKDYEEISKRLLAALQRAGIDTEIVALGRDDKGSFVYIIGARPWEPEKPQLWLNKETFLPVRQRVKVGDDIHEVRFLGYGTEATGNWFPKVMEEYENDVLVRRSEVTKIKINQELPESMFDIP